MFEGGKIMTMALIAIIACVVNLPFGFMRRRVRKFSFYWFLCIHFPIPLIVYLRLSMGLDYRVIPVFLGAAITGQVFGGKISDRAAARRAGGPGPDPKRNG